MTKCDCRRWKIGLAQITWAQRISLVTDILHCFDPETQSKIEKQIGELIQVGREALSF